MNSYFWQKPLKIGKRDTYTVDLSTWSKDEPIITLTTTTKSALVFIENNFIGTNPKGINSIVGVTVSGLLDGIEEITFNYSTSTRTDSETIKLKVGESCLI